VPNSHKPETWCSTVGKQRLTTPKPETQGLAEGNQCPMAPVARKYEKHHFS